jgi:hypothetical protein
MMIRSVVLSMLNSPSASVSEGPPVKVSQHALPSTLYTNQLHSSANGMARPQRLVCGPRLRRRYAKLKEHAMRTSQKTLEPIATIGVDLGKNTFHLVGVG